jgi:hypothetical protein
MAYFIISFQAADEPVLSSEHWSDHHHHEMGDDMLQVCSRQESCLLP